jgi:hypothetical protein
MSEASHRGKSFEREVAKLLRSKLGVRVERDKRSGAGVNKADITNYYSDLPLHLELKDQETLKIKEWYRQCKAGATALHFPTLVFRADDEILACLSLADLVNLLVEVKEQRAEIVDLRAPVNDTCKNGHITQGLPFCLQRDCKYSRGYRAKK